MVIEMVLYIILPELYIFKYHLCIILILLQACKIVPGIRWFYIAWTQQMRPDSEVAKIFIIQDLEEIVKHSRCRLLIWWTQEDIGINAAVGREEDNISFL